VSKKTEHVQGDIKPLGERILVRLQPEEATRLQNGIYLPALATERMSDVHIGEVLAVGTGKVVGKGALVIFPKDRGTRIPWDSNLRVLENEDAIAAVGK
jgi:co-chaperonin GroES (HSP10)